MARIRTGEMWRGLSPEYRNRLIRGGINEKRYVAGENLNAVRGHANTPEHPSDITKAKNRERYKDYVNRRNGLIRKVIEKKEAEYGNRHKFRPDASQRAVRINPATGKMPKMAYMQRYLADDFDFDNEVDFGDDEWAFIFYHAYA